VVDAVEGREQLVIMTLGAVDRMAATARGPYTQVRFRQ
jgi:hypothetical protein